MTDAPSILVVDTTPANITLLLETLSRAGYRVRVAQDGESALDQARHAPPSLVLLDVTMPGIDGFETCRRLRQMPNLAHVRVIFMTAFSDAQHKVKAFAAGADDYVTKPFDHEEVLARVQTHLARRAELTVALAEVEKLKSRLQQEVPTPVGEVLTLQALERAHFITVLKKTHGVIEGPKGAARLLNLKPSTARFRMKKLGIAKSDYLTMESR